MKNRGVAAIAAFWMTVALLLVSRVAGATVYSFTTSDSESTIRARLATLIAGDEVVLAAGTYTFGGIVAVKAAGTSGQPVIVHAASGAAVVWEPAVGQDGAVISQTTYLTIDGIEFAPQASDTNALRGIRITDSSSNITISNCNVHGFGNGIAVNVSGIDVSGLTITHNELHHFTGSSGEGIYLGCAGAACTVHDSVVEGNFIHDTQSTGGSGDGIEIKKGSTQIDVRDNVVAAVAQSCIQVFGGSIDGGAVSNTIERNACIKPSGSDGIDVGSDAIVRNNVVVAPAADGIAALTSDSVTPGNLTIQNNTLIVPSTIGIRLNSVAGTIAVYDNAIYAQSSDAIRATGTTSMVTALGNFGIGTLTGVSSGFTATGNLTNDFVGVAYDGSTLNAYPKAGSVLIGAADSTHLATDDYNGSIRGVQYDVGAYLYSATGNPGATIAAGFKTLPTPPESDAGTDAGSVLADGGSNDAGAKDGGASGSDASLGGDSGGATTTRDDAGSNGSNGGSPSDDSGCGCVIGPAADSGGFAAISLLFAGAALRRRRSRPRPRA